MNDPPVVALASQHVRNAPSSGHDLASGRRGRDRLEPDDVGHVAARTGSEHLEVVVTTVPVLAGGEVEARPDLGPTQISAAEGAQD
jgi:hypothetical protein